MKLTTFINFVLISNLVIIQSNVILVVKYPDKCFTDNDSGFVGKLMEFRKISPENCEIIMNDLKFFRSVYYVKFFTYFGVNRSFILATKKDIARIADQFRTSYSSNISNNSVPRPEELNLQHFMEIIYASTEFLSDLNIKELREGEIFEILTFHEQLFNLRVMDFSYNSFDLYIEQKLFLTFENLVLLNASHSELTMIRQGSFNNCPNLRHIDLSFNKIFEISDDDFSNLPELKIIDLRENPIKVIVGSFDRNSKLKTIRLNDSIILKDPGCNIFILLERSVLANILFSFSWELDTQCMADKLKISLENEELVIRSTNSSKVVKRIKYFNWITTVHFKFGANQLTNVSEFLEMLDSWNIKVLHLSGNSDGKLSATTFYRFFAIWTLLVIRTNLTDMNGNLFKELKHLEHLDISENNLKKLDVTYLSSLALDRLNISGNDLNNTHEIFRNLNSSVRILDVSDNDVGTIDENTFGKLNNLETLILKRTNLTNFDMKMKNSSIKMLDISHNHLTDVDFSSKKDDNRLETLIMSSNNLTELKGLTRASYPNLKYLHVDDNRFTCEYISDLKKNCLTRK